MKKPGFKNKKILKNLILFCLFIVISLAVLIGGFVITRQSFIIRSQAYSGRLSERAGYGTKQQIKKGYIITGKSNQIQAVEFIASDDNPYKPCRIMGTARKCSGKATVLDNNIIGQCAVKNVGYTIVSYVNCFSLSNKLKPVPKPAPVEFSLSQTGIKGSVLVGWKRTTDEAYVVAYKKSTDMPNKAEFLPQLYAPPNPQSLYQVYLNGARDSDSTKYNDYKKVSYDFEVFIDDGNYTWRTDIPVKRIIPVAIDLTTEKLLFVIPKSFTSVDYKTRINNYMADLNHIYSGTNKRLVLEDIMTYEDNACDGKGGKDYCGIVSNPIYSKPNTFPIIFVRNQTNDLIDGLGLYPRLYVRMTYDPNSNINIYFPDKGMELYWAKVVVMAHEFGHTFYAGIPELYFYLGKDNTNVEPIVPYPSSILTSLPDRFFRDVMLMQILDETSNFSPLSIAIINKNADSHEAFVYGADSETYNYYNTLPYAKIRIIDSQDRPIANASIKVYCIRDYWNEDGGSRLLDSTTSNTDGWAGIIGPTLGYLAQDCFVEAIKIYTPTAQKAVTLTAAEVQEAKIVENKNSFTLTVKMN